MLLNQIEFALMNNPLRASIQRRFEAKRLMQMGGSMHGGRALEIGCGRGIGLEIILDCFGARQVDAFDLDPRMIRRAARRLRWGTPVHLWIGDCVSIPVKDAAYDAVFDFGILHHVPDWRAAVFEVARVLKPGGRFYAEEVFGSFTSRPIVRRLLDHPQSGRFEASEFLQAMRDAGLHPEGSETLGRAFGWFTASRDSALDRADRHIRSSSS